MIRASVCCSCEVVGASVSTSPFTGSSSSSWRKANLFSVTATMCLLLLLSTPASVVGDDGDGECTDVNSDTCSLVTSSDAAAVKKLCAQDFFQANCGVSCKTCFEVATAKWTFEAKGPIASTPILNPSEDTIYVGSNVGDRTPGLYAISTDQKAHESDDDDDGQAGLKWGYATEKGCAAPPAITSDGKTVFIGCEDYTFHAINAATGKKLWTVDAKKEIRGKGAVTADNKYVYFASWDGKLRKVEVGSGRLAWTFTTSINGNGIRIYGQPLLNGKEDRIFFADYNSRLFSINTATGKRVWMKDMASKRGEKTVTTPAMSPDSSELYVGINRGYFKAFSAVDKDRGKQLWEFMPIEQLPYAIESSPVVSADGSTVFYGSGDWYLYALNTALLTSETSRLLWRKRATNALHGSPALSPYGSMVVIGGADFTLRGYDPVTGAALWKYETQGDIKNAPTFRSGEGIVYFGSGDRKIYAVQPVGIDLTTATSTATSTAVTTLSSTAVTTPTTPTATTTTTATTDTSTTTTATTDTTSTSTSVSSTTGTETSTSVSSTTGTETSTTVSSTSITETSTSVSSTTSTETSTSTSTSTSTATSTQVTTPTTTTQFTTPSTTQTTTATSTAGTPRTSFTTPTTTAETTTTTSTALCNGVPDAALCAETGIATCTTPSEIVRAAFTERCPVLCDTCPPPTTNTTTKTAADASQTTTSTTELRTVPASKMCPSWQCKDLDFGPCRGATFFPNTSVFECFEFEDAVLEQCSPGLIACEFDDFSTTSTTLSPDQKIAAGPDYQVTTTATATATTASKTEASNDLNLTAAAIAALNMSAQELLEGGATPTQLIDAGYTKSDLIAAGLGEAVADAAVAASVDADSATPQPNIGDIPDADADATKDDKGIVIGGTLAGVAILLTIIGLAIYLRKNRETNNDSNADECARAAAAATVQNRAFGIDNRNMQATYGEAQSRAELDATGSRVRQAYGEVQTAETIDYATIDYATIDETGGGGKGNALEDPDYMQPDVNQPDVYDGISEA